MAIRFSVTSLLRPTLGASPSPLLSRSFSSSSSLLSQVPTIEEAKKMPKKYAAMSNDLICVMAADGDTGAKKERLVREIMSVDEIEHPEALKVVQEMNNLNKTFDKVVTLPYKLGMTTALTAGVASVPLVFDLNTALWFNRDYVTTDVPEPEDLETWLEVGSWTWNWMEPPLGQLSFFLLTLGYARAQMLNLGASPYSSFVRTRRALRTVDEFPQYESVIVKDYVMHSDWQ